MAEIEIEVCYARPDRVFRRTLRVRAGSDIGYAIDASGLLQAEAGLELTQLKVGVYGKLKTLDTPLKAGDRVEIYRGLIADPKEARRRRAAHKSAKSGSSSSPDQSR